MPPSRDIIDWSTDWSEPEWIESRKQWEYRRLNSRGQTEVYYRDPVQPDPSIPRAPGEQQSAYYAPPSTTPTVGGSSYASTPLSTYATSPYEIAEYGELANSNYTTTAPSDPSSSLGPYTSTAPTTYRSPQPATYTSYQPGSPGYASNLQSSYLAAAPSYDPVNTSEVLAQEMGSMGLNDVRSSTSPTYATASDLLNASKVTNGDPEA